MSNRNYMKTWLSPSTALTRFKAPAAAVTDNQELLLGHRAARFGFRLGNYGLLIAEQTSSEVLEPLPIYRIPGCSNDWLGLVNLRGNLVPVYDLSAIFAWQRDTNAKTMMLFLGQGESMVGILIDGLPLEPDLAEPLPELPENIPASLSACTARAYQEKQVVWLEFNHEQFFENYLSQRSNAVNS